MWCCQWRQPRGVKKSSFGKQLRNDFCFFLSGDIYSLSHLSSALIVLSISVFHFHLWLFVRSVSLNVHNFVWLLLHLSGASGSNNHCDCSSFVNSSECRCYSCHTRWCGGWEGKSWWTHADWWSLSSAGHITGVQDEREWCNILRRSSCSAWQDVTHEQKFVCQNYGDQSWSTTTESLELHFHVNGVNFMKNKQKLLELSE